MVLVVVINLSFMLMTKSNQLKNQLNQQVKLIEKINIHLFRDFQGFQRFKKRKGNLNKVMYAEYNKNNPK